MNSKKQLTALLMTAALAGSAMITPTVLANTTGQSIEEQADITNWVANTPQQISNNMVMQHINTNDLNGTKYIVQWGDTLSGISAATGISVAKIAYDNHIQNINLIYAGQTLILNKNGSVPQNYRPQGDPNLVVISKTTINNGPKNVTFVVSPKVTTKNYQSSNGDTTTTNNSTTNTTTDNDDDNSSTGTQSHSKHSKSNNSSTSNEDMDANKLAKQLKTAAGSNGDDVSYNAYDDNDSDSMKSVDLDDDTDEINSLVQKGTKKSIRKAESLIKSHLSDDDDEAYVDYQDGEVSVYTKKKSDKNSSSSDDQDSSSQNDDSDSDNSSNQSQDTNDDYDADEDDD